MTDLGERIQTDQNKSDDMLGDSSEGRRQESIFLRQNISNISKSFQRLRHPSCFSAVVGVADDAIYVWVYQVSPVFGAKLYIFKLVC